MSGSKILAFRDAIWSLFGENIFDCVRIFVYVKRPQSQKYFLQTKICQKQIFVKNFSCRKFPWSSEFIL